MPRVSLNNDQRITGYLDSLLAEVSSNEVPETNFLANEKISVDDHSTWNEKLAQAVGTATQTATVAEGCFLLTTEPLGTGNIHKKRTQLLDVLSITRLLPPSLVKDTMLLSCLPLAAEAMIGE